MVFQFNRTEDLNIFLCHQNGFNMKNAFSISQLPFRLICFFCRQWAEIFLRLSVKENRTHFLENIPLCRGFDVKNRFETNTVSQAFRMNRRRTKNCHCNTNRCEKIINHLQKISILKTKPIEFRWNFQFKTFPMSHSITIWPYFNESSNHRHQYEINHWSNRIVDDAPIKNPSHLSI